MFLHRDYIFLILNVHSGYVMVAVAVVMMVNIVVVSNVIVYVAVIMAQPIIIIIIIIIIRQFIRRRNMSIKSLHYESLSCSFSRCRAVSSGH